MYVSAIEKLLPDDDSIFNMQIKEKDY